MLAMSCCGTTKVLPLVSVHLSQFRCTPLHWACSHGYVEAVRTLLKARADVNARDVVRRSPLRPSIEATVVLRQQRSDQTSCTLSPPPFTQWRRTPLHWAATDGHVDAIQMLLEAGASVDAADAVSASPANSGRMRVPYSMHYHRPPLSCMQSDSVALLL